MKLHLLRYFSVLAEELHFGRAAERLAITQPPLSNAIKSLEGELQVQLLERSSKHVELTAAGAAFLEEVHQILEGVDRAGSIAKAVAKGVRGQLHIGMAGSLVYREVPAIVRAFELANPGIELMLRELSTAEQVEAVLGGQLNAGFINALAVPPQLKSLALNDDDFVLCLPASHPMAGNDEVDLRDLANEKFVMFARDIAPANHDNVIAIFNRIGIHPRTVHAARQWLTIVAMVANDLGLSVVPRSMARSKVAGVSFVPLRGQPAHTPAMLVWNPMRTNAALNSFLNSAVQTVRRLAPKRSGGGILGGPGRAPRRAGHAAGPAAGNGAELPDPSRGMTAHSQRRRH